MTSTAADLSWQVLNQIVHDWAGADAELDEVKALHGGSISTTVAIHCKAGDRAVLKVTQHRIDRSYADEAHQLQLMRRAGLPVPEVYRCVIGSLDSPFSYLLMQYVDGIDLAQAKGKCSPEEFEAVQSELAALVLRLHSQTAPHYGRIASDDSSTSFESWPHCYRDIFDPIWRDVEKSSALPPKCRKTMSRIHERLGQLLVHDDCPRLVHWDLWSSNLLVKHDDSSGQWRVAAILDPHCKYAHAEAELAYLELFKTVTPAFMRTYQQARRLSSEYHDVRKPVYQLYSMLDHLNLFGHEYLKPTIKLIEKVGGLV